MLLAAQVLHAVDPSARPSRLSWPLGRAIRKPVAGAASSNQVGKGKAHRREGSDGPWEPAARWRRAAYGLNQFRRGSVPKKKPVPKAGHFFAHPYRVVRPDPVDAEMGAAAANRQAAAAHTQPLRGARPAGDWGGLGTGRALTRIVGRQAICAVLAATDINIF